MQTRLEVYLDLGNIAGYRALNPTLALLKDTAVEVNWLPVSGIIPRPLGREHVHNAEDPLDAYKAKRAKARRGFEQRELERDCIALGLEVEIAAMNLDATRLHQAMLWLNQRSEAAERFIEAAYERRFRDGLSLGSVAEVAGLLADNQYDASAFLEKVPSLDAELKQHQAAALELGVFDSPAYRWQNELFQGRQHLPLIRWHITGHEGAPPT